MTVAQLRNELSKYPDNMDVFVAERKTEYAYGLVNSVRSQEINFIDDPFEDAHTASAEVVIIDEE